MLYLVNINKTERGYEVLPTAHTCKDLRETELWLRANFQVTPNEWSDLRRRLESGGKVSFERSAGKSYQVG